ncbi:MAG: extensin family protein [Pseudomonadota bacterium]
MRFMGLAGLLLAVLSGCGLAQEEEDTSLATKDETCGVPGLVAVAREPVQGRGACGVAKPVVVTRVAGVTLSQPSIMTCETAGALAGWVASDAKRLVGTRGGGLSELTVAAHYVCKTRNSQRGARLSEHAKGRAIDISGFVMKDGSEVTVREGWRKESDTNLMRQLHRSACGPFGTVLGPNSDRFHQSHFHFDTAAYRSGPYCR